jgi:predicted  nucleic acid-binding Zn-ribbon protein
MREFHYIHAFHHHDPDEPLMKKLCRRCGAEFSTKSRIKKRCDGCQASVKAQRNEARKAASDQRKDALA